MQHVSDVDLLELSLMSIKRFLGAIESLEFHI